MKCSSLVVVLVLSHTELAMLDVRELFVEGLEFGTPRVDERNEIAQYRILFVGGGARGFELRAMSQRNKTNI